MDELTRRHLLALGLAGGASLAGPAVGLARAPRREAAVRGGRFLHGVACGDPHQHGAVLWTRVDGIERSGRLRLEIAADRGFSKLVDRRDVRAAAVRDYTARVRVDSPRLLPGERYFYRFSSPDSESPVGTFRTLRPPDSAEPVRIALWSCQKYVDGFYPAHRGLADEDVDLVVGLGDYVYEGNGQGVRDDASSTGENGEAETLADYRAKYRLYQSDPDLQAMHAAHPFVVIWDDHEVENDYSGAKGIDRPARPRVPFAARRANAYLAYFEHMPVVRMGGERNRIYRTLRLGALAELFLLDGRQYREEGRTMLGAAQHDWLAGGVPASTATWKLVANQTMMMGNDLPAGTTVDTDGWDGFPAERRALLAAWRDRGAKDVAVLTGDEHEFYAGLVSPSGHVDEPAVATEFVGGSITSGAEPDAATRAALALATVGLRTQNPQWTYAESTRQGYQVVEARPDELRVTFRSPTSVFVRGAPMEDLARFRVPRGSASVEQG